MSTRENAVHEINSANSLRRQETDLSGRPSYDASQQAHGMAIEPAGAATGEIGVGGGNDLASQWARVKARMAVELGDATFNSWVKPVDMIGLGDGKVVLSAPTRFIRSWVASHQSERLLMLWREEDTSIERVEVMVRNDVRAPTEHTSPGEERQGTTGRPAPVPQAGVTSSAAPSGFAKAKPGFAKPMEENFAGEPVGAPLDERFTFDNFVVGKSNELAHAAARRVAEATDVTFNPLFLYGGVGLGKTHLMHAIAWEIRRRHPERKVLYLSAEKFMYQFVRALRFKDTMAFKQQFRTVDVLMIDDVQFISGKDSTQEEFFHTFNALIDHNHQVIISADRSPSDLDGIEERIRSRLGWGLVADIHATDYELRLGILQAKAESMARHAGAVEIPAGVLELLASRITNNVRELEGALTRVVAYASLVGRPISVEMAMEVLRDLLRSHEPKITIEDIQRRVAQYYNIRLADMLSPRRARTVARPRQIAMYLSKQLTTRSLPEIGRKFGGRDHTTVIHAVRRIDELCREDSSMEEDVDLLRRMLEGATPDH
ncbi:MAG: chromosomal replication initiator protein DnaA [Parvibaculaceae bacterium]|jgi:chromosomal replication initiator protein|nr:chromosomal replication initiator protein DnaA [Parvibaculaceae bacterium]